jgi:hypothetical protein
MNVIYLQEAGPLEEKKGKTISCEGGLRVFSLGGLSKTFWNANAGLRARPNLKATRKRLAIACKHTNGQPL